MSERTAQKHTAGMSLRYTFVFRERYVAARKLLIVAVEPRGRKGVEAGEVDGLFAS